MRCYYLNVHFQGQRANLYLFLMCCFIKHRSFPTFRFSPLGQSPTFELILNIEGAVVWREHYTLLTHGAESNVLLCGCKRNVTIWKRRYFSCSLAYIFFGHNYTHGWQEDISIAIGTPDGYQQIFNLKIDVFSDMTLYIIVTDHQRFGDTCLYLQYYRWQQSS